MPSNHTPRGLTVALTTGSTLIVALAVAERALPAEKWPLRIAALAVLVILTVIAAAHNGRPEQPRPEQ
jgi:hypothetical protein